MKRYRDEDTQKKPGQSREMQRTTARASKHSISKDTLQYIIDAFIKIIDK